MAHILQNNSDFGPYLLDFEVKWLQKLCSSKNMKKTYSQLDPPHFSAHSGALRFPPIWHTFQNMCHMDENLMVPKCAGKSGGCNCVQGTSLFFD